QGIILPPSWDKESISMVFRDLQNRPGAVSIFTQALVERFVTGQGDKTAKVRIEYLKTKLEELKITKELQGELDDLLFRQADLDVRRLQKEIEKGDLEHRRRTQAELRAAEPRAAAERGILEALEYGFVIVLLSSSAVSRPKSFQWLELHITKELSMRFAPGRVRVIPVIWSDYEAVTQWMEATDLGLTHPLDLSRVDRNERAGHIVEFLLEAARGDG